MSARARDIAERVVSTYLYGLATFLITGGQFNISTLQVAAWAAMPAAISLAYNLVAPLIQDANGLSWQDDLVKRVILTAFEAFTTSSTMALHYDKSAALAAGSAAIAAVLSLLKGGLAAATTGSGTAGFTTNVVALRPPVPAGSPFPGDNFAAQDAA